MRMAQDTSACKRACCATSMTERPANSSSLAAESRLARQGSTQIRHAKSWPAALPLYSV